MADKSAQADIRGINIDRVVKQLYDEELKMKDFCTQVTTNSREIRYWTKTAGYLDSTDTTGITATQLYNVAEGALPDVVEQSWTKSTTYIKLFKVESPWINIEDIKDNDVDLFAANLRDLTKAIANRVDKRIYNVIADVVTAVPADGTSVTSAAATADGWDDAATGDPVTDILAAKEHFRTYRFNPEGAVMVLHPTDYKNLIKFFINVKGSSVPQFASEAVKNGTMPSILGVKIYVTTQAVTDYALLFIPKLVAHWKQFMPITAHVIDEPGIAKKIRVIEEGECVLVQPYASYVITDTQV